MGTVARSSAFLIFWPRRSPMGALDDCCMYFCSGLSAFAVGTLFFMGIVLLRGGGWYLDISDTEATTSAQACFFAGFIYVLYLVFCVFKIMNKKPDEDDKPDPQV